MWRVTEMVLLNISLNYNPMINERVSREGHLLCERHRRINVARCTPASRPSGSGRAGRARQSGDAIRETPLRCIVRCILSHFYCPLFSPSPLPLRADPPSLRPPRCGPWAARRRPQSRLASRDCVERLLCTPLSSFLALGVEIGNFGANKTNARNGRTDGWTALP